MTKTNVSIIGVKVSENAKNLIDLAAKHDSRTRSSFLLHAALKYAKEVLPDDEGKSIVKH